MWKEVRKKIIQVRNSGLHKQRNSIELRINEGKIKTFNFLILNWASIQKFVTIKIATMYLTVRYIFLNDSNDTKDRRGRLGLSCYWTCYYKVFAPTVKECSIIWKWTWFHCKCILQTLQQPPKEVQLIRQEREKNWIV